MFGTFSQTESISDFAKKRFNGVQLNIELIFKTFDVLSGVFMTHLKKYPFEKISNN